MPSAPFVGLLLPVVETFQSDPVFVPAKTPPPEVCPKIISEVVNIAQIGKSQSFYKE
jgi:hypothetical protein